MAALLDMESGVDLAGSGELMSPDGGKGPDRNPSDCRGPRGPPNSVGISGGRLMGRGCSMEPGGPDNIYSTF